MAWLPPDMSTDDTAEQLTTPVVLTLTLDGGLWDNVLLCRVGNSLYTVDDLETLKWLIRDQGEHL